MFVAGMNRCGEGAGYGMNGWALSSSLEAGEAGGRVAGGDAVVDWRGPGAASLSSCPQSVPASGYFPMSQFFVSGGQSTGASTSASVLPMNIQD